MIMETLTRAHGHQVMQIHRLPSSGRYALEVTSGGRSDNANWQEEFATLRESIEFAKSYGWEEE